MKKILLFIATVLLCFQGFSQTTEAEKDLIKKSEIKEDGWVKGGVTTLGFNQVSLTNWAAGGSNSIAANGLVKLFANMKKGKTTWDNNLDLAYGLIRNGNSKAPWVKNDDRIDFSSKVGRSAFGTWYYAGLLNFRSQFTPGYSDPAKTIKISDLLAPGYLLAAVGMDYKPSENFTLFIAPLTSKMTFVMDQDLANAGAYGVEKGVYDDLGNLTTKGSNFRAEMGGYLKMAYKRELGKNVSFGTTVDMFSNYLNNPQNIDVNWTTSINMKVNEYISANFGTHLIYDDDIDIAYDNNKDGVTDGVGPRTQFKQIFGAGFSYKF